MTMELDFPLVLLFGLTPLAFGNGSELTLEVSLHEVTILVELLHKKDVIPAPPLHELLNVVILPAVGQSIFFLLMQ